MNYNSNNSIIKKCPANCKPHAIKHTQYSSLNLPILYLYFQIVTKVAYTRSITTVAVTLTATLVTASSSNFVKRFAWCSTHVFL